MLFKLHDVSKALELAHHTSHRFIFTPRGVNSWGRYVGAVSDTELVTSEFVGSFLILPMDL